MGLGSRPRTAQPQVPSRSLNLGQTFIRTPLSSSSRRESRITLHRACPENSHGHLFEVKLCPAGRARRCSCFLFGREWPTNTRTTLIPGEKMNSLRKEIILRSKKIIFRGAFAYDIWTNYCREPFLKLIINVSTGCRQRSKSRICSPNRWTRPPSCICLRSLLVSSGSEAL